MSDFVTPFWSWFIGVWTVGGFAFLFWLLWWQTRGRRPLAGEPAASVGHVWDGDLQELNNPMPRWWLNLFLITMVFGIVYLVLFPGVGAFRGVLRWTQTGQYDAEVAAAGARFDPIYERFAAAAIPDLAEDRAALAIGQRLFMTYCTTCHGSDARGVPGFPNLSDHDWLWGGTPDQIKTSIANGRQGVMASWKDALSREQIFNVAQYVRGLGGNAIDPVVRLNGGEVFQQYCVACHGADGTGNQLLGAPNLTDDIWLHGSSQRTIIDVISAGRTGRMPAHQEFLGEAKVHLLANYIYSLSIIGRE
jgi:cytochrome c oxidase cbb3-type subunit 3